MLPLGADDGFLWADTVVCQCRRSEGTTHDSANVVGNCCMRAAGWTGDVGKCSGSGFRPGMGRAVWPHGLGAVLPLSIRLVSAEFLGQRILPLERGPLFPLSAGNAGPGL